MKETRCNLINRRGKKERISRQRSCFHSLFQGKTKSLFEVPDMAKNVRDIGKRDVMNN